MFKCVSVTNCLDNFCLSFNIFLGYDLWILATQFEILSSFSDQQYKYLNCVKLLEIIANIMLHIK